MDATTLTLPLITVIALGAYHGLNPGMGWLFAVALGVQEQKRAAVLRAFLPITLGHAASVAIVVALFALAQQLFADLPLRALAAALLIGVGIYKLFHAHHQHWMGMRVGFRDLTIWSFLMATAHGAGLMLLPVLLGVAGAEGTRAASLTNLASEHAAHLQAATPEQMIAAVTLHTLAMFLMMAGVAMVVYEKAGSAIWRTRRINLDLIWAIALIIAGLLALII